MMNEEKAIDNRKRVKEWKLKNPEKLREQRKRYRLKNKNRLRLYDHNRYILMRDKAAKYDELTGGQKE